MSLREPSPSQVWRCFRQPFDLIKKDTRQFHDEKRKRCRLILDRFFKNFHIRRPLCGHDAVLRQMTAERVYQLRALPDQKIPRPEQHGARLLSLGLNRDKAHRRSTSASAIASASVASFF